MLLANMIHKQHLQWLLLSLAWVLALLASYLPVWVSATVIVLAIWRYQIEMKGWKLPKLIIIVPATMLAGLGIIFTFKIGRAHV